MINASWQRNTLGVKDQIDVSNTDGIIYTHVYSYHSVFFMSSVSNMSIYHGYCFVVVVMFF